MSNFTHYFTLSTWYHVWHTAANQSLFSRRMNKEWVTIQICCEDSPFLKEQGLLPEGEPTGQPALVRCLQIAREDPSSEVCPTPTSLSPGRYSPFSLEVAIAPHLSCFSLYWPFPGATAMFYLHEWFFFLRLPQDSSQSTWNKPPDLCWFCWRKTGLLWYWRLVGCRPKPAKRHLEWTHL